MAISQKEAIQQEFKILCQQANHQLKKNELTYKNISIWNQSYYQQNSTPQINKHKFGVYADKQLTHLVIQETFDFNKIAKILSYSFQTQPEKFTQTNCRERWYEIHRDWEKFSKINNQIKQNKRIQSILNISNPFQNYNVDQLLEKMQNEQSTSSKQKNIYIQEPKYQGYNIFKDSIRRIDDLVQYEQGKKAMYAALQLAKLKTQQQKPMLYTPHYQRGCNFQIIESQLTIQKMKQLMSHQIEMDLVSRELKVQQTVSGNFQSKIRKQLELKQQKEKHKKQYQDQIQDNWDQYESD